MGERDGWRLARMAGLLFAAQTVFTFIWAQRADASWMSYLGQGLAFGGGIVIAIRAHREATRG